MGDARVTCLVVGGCGFLGHHIVKQLVEEKVLDVAVLDLRTNRNRFPGVQYFDGDITSAKDVNAVLEQVEPDVLFHTVSPLAMQENRALFDKVNVQGTENLLECAGKSEYVKAFIFTSSASVVHDGRNDLVNVDESTPVLLAPTQPEYYSHTKAVAEMKVLAANRKYGDMLTCALRPSGIFGEGDTQAIPGFMAVYEDGKHKWQIGQNKNMWEWTYAGNVAHAHLLAAKALLKTHTARTPPKDHEKVEGEAFFVTNDSPAPFWDFPRLVWREAGWTGTAEDAIVIPRTLGMFIAGLLEWIYWIIFFGSKEPVFKTRSVQFSTMYRTFDITKAKQRLGYEPIVNVQTGVERGVRAYLEQKQRTAEEKKAL